MTVFIATLFQFFCQSIGTDTEAEKTDGEKEAPAKTILVAEDNVLNQKVIAKMLEKHKKPFRIVADGQQTVDAYTSNPSEYNLILMDVCMPVMDGLAATRAIRAFEQQASLPRVIIVALSAQVMESDQSECTKAGMDGFLEKPVNPTQLKRIWAQSPKK